MCDLYEKIQMLFIFRAIWENTAHVHFPVSHSNEHRFVQSGMSFTCMKSKINNGPSIDPCVIPDATGTN